MKWISGIAEYLWRVRHQLRFGERSRLPLRLMRLELRENLAECEWIARPCDPWDVDLPARVREESATWQALRDALSVREMLFKSVPEVDSARFKVYRLQEGTEPQLIITGSVSRQDEPPPRMSSIVMQAKLCGFRFNLSDGALESLSTEPASLQFANQ